MSAKDEPFAETREAVSRAVREALDEAEGIADNDVAYRQASWLVDTFSAGMNASGRMRVDAARRIRDENHLSLSQLGERLGVSKARAADMLRVPKEQRVEGAPLIAPIVTSDLGVLAAWRRGKSWAFITSEQQPGETIASAAIRTIKEQTRLDIRPGRTVVREPDQEGSRSTIYIAAGPIDRSQVDADTVRAQGWTEARWLALAEAEELLPEMYGPVNAYLTRALRPRYPKR